MCKGRPGVLKIEKRLCVGGKYDNNIFSTSSCAEEQEGSCMDAVCYFSEEQVCDQCNSSLVIKQEPDLGCWRCIDPRMTPETSCLVCFAEFLQVGSSCFHRCPGCKGLNDDCHFVDDTKTRAVCESRMCIRNVVGEDCRNCLNDKMVFTDDCLRCINQNIEIGRGCVDCIAEFLNIADNCLSCLNNFQDLATLCE